MVNFAIVLSGVGLMLCPLSIMFVAWRSKKEGSKFTNPVYAAKAKAILLTIAFALMGVSSYLLFRDNDSTMFVLLLLCFVACLIPSVASIYINMLVQKNPTSYLAAYNRKPEAYAPKVLWIFFGVFLSELEFGFVDFFC